MMKLCDIEDGLRDIQPSLGREYQLSLLALLAHVRALEGRVAALAGPVIPVDLSEIHAELDRLRAENAELRKHVDVMCRDCRDEYNRRMRGK